VKKELIAICFSLSLCTTTIAQTLQPIGRGLCSTADGILKTKEAAALFGDSSLTDYQVRFSARTPVSESQVQIWAGFRVKDRQDFYSLGLRGGEQNSLYLARRGYMGRDEFLALRPLGFHPLPGTWYDLRIVVTATGYAYSLATKNNPVSTCGIRIAICYPPERSCWEADG
jgi:beta-galactosidase